MTTRRALSISLHSMRRKRLSLSEPAKAVKTRRGVQSEFFRLTKDDPYFTQEQRIFLAQAYNFKAIADYETGTAELSADQANAAVKRGRGFIDTVRCSLSPQPLYDAEIRRW